VIWVYYIYELEIDTISKEWLVSAVDTQPHGDGDHGKTIIYLEVKLISSTSIKKFIPSKRIDPRGFER
jgi:hypothetical protein